MEYADITSENIYMQMDLQPKCQGGKRDGC